jgi:hypothetical protein
VRARQEAQHPALDWLHPLLSAVLELEMALLGSCDLRWTDALSRQVEV